MSKSFLCFSFKCHILCDAGPALQPSVLGPQKLRTHIMESPYGRVLFQSPVDLIVLSSSKGFSKHSQ